MALPIAPGSVTLYDVVKDLGFPIAVSLILLLEIGPKLDSVLQTNQQLQAEYTTLSELCVTKVSSA